MFGGVEYSERDLTIPQLLLEDGLTWATFERAGDERLARAYLFGAAHPWLTLGAEYQYEDFELDPELFFSVQQGQDAPGAALRAVLPPVRARRLRRRDLPEAGGRVPDRSTSSTFVPGDRSFWVVDAALRYRLPKRYGFLVAGVNNLTDETSTYEATDPRNLAHPPGAGRLRPRGAGLPLA